MKDKKISIVEVVFILPLVMFLDTVEFFTADGSSLLVFLEGGVFASLQGYLLARGVHLKSHKRMLAGNVIELIPAVGAAPIRTIAFIAAVYAANRPEKFKEGAKRGWLLKRVLRDINVKMPLKEEEGGDVIEFPSQKEEAPSLDKAA